MFVQCKHIVAKKPKQVQQGTQCTLKLIYVYMVCWSGKMGRLAEGEWDTDPTQVEVTTDAWPNLAIDQLPSK